MKSDELTRARGLLSHLVSKADATMHDYRRLYDEVLAHFVAPADAQMTDVDAGGVPSIWVSAPGADAAKVAVYIHGGGWCMGNASGYREMGYRVSKASGCRVLVVDYRLAPEHPYPAPLDDTVAAYRWAAKQSGVKSLALIGDSAGGGLAVAAAAVLRDGGDKKPAAVVVMSPLVDLAGKGASITERAHLDPLPAAGLVQAMGGAYLGGKDLEATPLASPLYADLRDFPPTFILVGSDEGLHDDSTRLVKKLKDQGTPVDFEIGEDMIHIWPVFNFLPEAHHSMDRIGKFLSKHL